MSAESRRSLRLTAKERLVLTMVMDGKGLEVMAASLGQSVKTIERHLEHGLTKLETWSEHLSGINETSALEKTLFVLTRAEGIHRIAQCRRQHTGTWGCIVLVCLGDGAERDCPDDQVAHHIRASLRKSDVVSKWAPKEWVIYLCSTSETDLSQVVRRLHAADEGLPRLRTAYYLGGKDSTIHEGVNACHAELVERHAKAGLSEVWRTGPFA